MRRITALQPQKRNPNRVNVHLDGEFAFPLDKLVAAWLKVGQELSDEKIASLQSEDEREKAYQQALLFLSYRARSSREVRQNLEKHEIPAAVIESVMQRLREAGLVNDEQFARAWVENRSTFRPRSHRALTAELRRKGLPDEAIQSALEEGADDEALAYQAGRRQAHRLEGLDWPTFRQKLTAHLARRGFAYSAIAGAVRRVWDETSGEPAGHISDNEEIS